MTALPRIDNARARTLFLHRHGLGETPAGSGKGMDLQGIIDELGFVQVDTINTVARAHHMILHARRPAYRPRALALLHDRDRGAFEHWTHDASIIAMPFFPHWRLKFRRYEAALADRWAKWGRQVFQEKIDGVLDHIATHGACSTSDVGEDEARSSAGWWDWNPSKIALEYLWRTGRLSVTRREGFRKVYDLTENVIPAEHLNTWVDEAQTIDWACRAALLRLGFATPGEVAAFFDLITPVEAKAWCADALDRGDIVEVEIAQADGRPRKAYLAPETLEEDPPAPPGRMRVLSPFDPALRDRKRAERLFGFSYRIEIFVPEAKRQYGYYVFPLLEGDRLVGRIDMKAERDRDHLHVKALWPEAGVRFGSGRLARLESALERTAKLAAVSHMNFADGWLRDTKG